MAKSLVLAEKPSVGRDIARVLGCQKKNNGYMEGKDHIVTWALGHLITLAAPEKYNMAYSEWRLEPLPMLPNPFKLEVIKNTSKQFSLVRKLLERNDVDRIIIATDAGREGELVARWILDYTNSKKPIKRLWISSVTDKAIRDGFRKLVDGRQYDRLYRAAYARAKADWIVGINGTRALTCKHNASLSMGRVQTPTLGIVAKREEEIRCFKSKNFYEITTNLTGADGGMKLRWSDRNGQTRLYSKEKGEAIAGRCRNKTGKVNSYDEKLKKTYPKGLYDLTELQREANRLYGFSAKETLNIMQALYERHKVLTYPRTDSKYITEDIVETLADRVRACRRSGMKDVCGSILKTPIKGNKSFVDNSKVGDHHVSFLRKWNRIISVFHRRNRRSTIWSSSSSCRYCCRHTNTRKSAWRLMWKVKCSKGRRRWRSSRAGGSCIRMTNPWPVSQNRQLRRRRISNKETWWKP